jgi:SSS family solute:Na+ symporter
LPIVLYTGAINFKGIFDVSGLFGVDEVYGRIPEKFNVIGPRDSVMPFGTLFTGLVIIQVYFRSMHQCINRKYLHMAGEFFVITF